MYVCVRIGRASHIEQRYIHLNTGWDIGREGGVLSYPFYHNNSPAMYKYTRIYVCTKVVGYVGWKVQGSTWSSPSSIYLSIHPLHPPELLFFSSSSPPVLRAYPLLALPFSACRTAVKQTPPLTSRIKPFNCRIVFDGSFSFREIVCYLNFAMEERSPFLQTGLDSFGSRRFLICVWGINGEFDDPLLSVGSIGIFDRLQSLKKFQIISRF